MAKYRLSPLQNTEKSKARIMRNVKMHIEEPVVRKKTVWMPIVVSLLLFAIIITVALPNVNQALPKGEISIEKVEIPGVEYAGLVMSAYIEETKEIIYQQENAIKAFNIDTNKTEVLVTVEDAMIFDSAINENWIVWMQFGDEQERIYAKNRQSGEVKRLNLQYFHDIHLDGDEIIVVSYMEREFDYKDIGYVRYNLKSDEFVPIQIFTDGNVGQGVYDNKRLVVTEESKRETLFKIYNSETLENTGNIIRPITEVQRMQLQGSEVFMQYRDDEGFKLGVLNIETKTFDEIEVDEYVTDFATDGQIFAISVANGDRNSVELYKRNGLKLEKYSILPAIQERTVRPRIEGSTFVVNGDGIMQTIYLITNE